MAPVFTRQPLWDSYLQDSLGRRAARVAAREQATAKKCPFQRAIAVHAAAAETGGFAGRIEPAHDLAVLAEHARIEIGLKTAQRLAGQNVELHRNQRTMRGIENPVRLRRADQAVADVTPRIVDVDDLRVLGIGVFDLAVARLDLGLDGVWL